MVYAVTDYGVVSAPTLADLNKKMNTKFDKDEFTFCGPDQIVKTSSKDIEFVQDKKKLSAIMFGNFFRKDNKVLVIAALGTVFTVVNFFLLTNMYKTLKGFIAACGG